MRIIIKLILIVVLVSCGNNDNATNSDTGQGGSTARFAIVGDYLYTVDESSLNVFSISNLTSPVFLNEVFVGFRIETLFAYENNLFIGSQNGMFIYSLSNPETPIRESSVSHFTSCDPVITDGVHAYVTLHSNSNCGNNINILEVYNVTNIQNPVLVHSRNLIHPKGLGLYNNYLIVCDDEVKIFNVTDPENIVFETSINVQGFDVIIQDNLLIVVASDGLYQYELNPNNISDITALSELVI